MPEGHTLHRLARDHRKHFAGQRVSVTSPQGRFASEAQRLDGREFVGAQAWGKHLVHEYDGGLLVHVHLGLYGAFTDQAVPMDDPVGQVRMRIVGPTIGTDLRGPTACEIYSPADLSALTERLGPDPLRRDADPARAWARIARSSQPIAQLLMDQKVLAGVGNVYRAELLFRHRLAPMTPGRDLSEAQWTAMWDDLVALMRVGVRKGRMHVVRPEDDYGAPSYAPDRPRTYVYRRAGEPCRICGTPIMLAELAARKLYWCPSCQAARMTSGG